MQRKPVTRRKVLSGLAATLLLPAGLHLRAENIAPEGAFMHGVASGDPDQTSVVLWTRLTVAGGSAGCRWELAADSDFRQVLRGGQVSTGAERDYTVKVLVAGLAPGQTYYYRFLQGNTASPTGRTRTLPAASLESLGLAVASCSNMPFGYFNAYEAIALDPAVEYVLHLGDYLYEYAADGYGARTGEQLGRQPNPPHEMVSLDDYRLRHAQYKADPQSQLMHAAHPLIPLWDDHESTNNPWQGGAENHQPDTEGSWVERRRVSLRAWYEWMPVRDPAPAQDPAAYWRHFRFGDLASLVTLETRHTGRVKQIDYDREALASMDVHAAQRFLAEVVGAPGRDMLARPMEDFAAAALAESVSSQRPWRLIGNQIPMARTLAPRLDAADLKYLQERLSESSLERARYFARLGELGLPLYLDPWDGYPRAREAFYQRCRAAGVTDLVVLTGDSHSFWHNRLHDAEGTPMGVELGTTAISSPGDFLEFGVEGAQLMDQRLMAANPEVEWTEGIHNGYLRLRITRDALHADFIGVSNILSRHYTTILLREVILRRENGLLAQILAHTAQ